MSDSMDISGSGPNTVSATRGRMLGRVLAGGIPLALALLLSGLCYVSAGATLGLYLGGLAVVAILVPPLALGQEALTDGVLAAGGVFVGVAIVWLVPMFRSVVGFSEWFGACMVLGSFAVGLLGMAWALRGLLGSAVVGSALTVFLGLAWLTWPIWLAPELTGARREQIVAGLVYVHPQFALSGAMRSAFPVPWAQYRIAYVLTNIGDDIPYEMPASIVPCLLLHLLVGAVLLLGDRVVSWRRVVKHRRTKRPLTL